MNKKFVKTVSGKQLPLTLVHKFNNGYYEIGTECVQMPNGRFYKIGKIVVYDYSEKKFVFKAKHPNLEHGIVDVDDNRNAIQYGYFTPSEVNVFLSLTDFDTVIVLSDKIASKIGIKLVTSGNYILKNNYNSNLDKKACIIPTTLFDYNTNQNTIFKAVTTYKKYLKLNDIVATKESIDFGKTHNYTLGLEYETSNGTIANSKKYGLITLRDGSLRSENCNPYEFASIPLEPKQILDTVKLQTEVLNYHCEFNHQCSLHLHFGNFKFSNALKLYKLLQVIQNDLMLMFPASKLNPELIGISKNYCKVLPNIEFDSYKELARFFGSFPVETYNFIVSDYIDQGINPNARYKWYNLARYHIVNFEKLFFSINRTVEFRVHEPTFDYNKIINWVKICIALLKKAESIDNDNEYKDLTFIKIIDEYYPELVPYIILRQNYFKKLKNEDLINYLTLKNDKALFSNDTRIS